MITIAGIGTDLDGTPTGQTTLSEDLDCDDPGEVVVRGALPDCDDGDPAIYPGAAESAGDEVDEDCDGLVLCYVDGDDDGVTLATPPTSPSLDADCDDPNEDAAISAAPDCDDTSAAVHPGAVEVPGGEVDEDCDGRVLCATDADMDGYAVAVASWSPDADCSDAGEAAFPSPLPDCADDDPAIHPGATELPGGEVDADCDGSVMCFRDADLDGFTADSTEISTDADCADPGEATALSAPMDCDDSNADVSPGGTETAGNRTDEDCDGQLLCQLDGDHDGFAIDGVIQSQDLDCDDLGEAEVVTGLDCDDALPEVHPSAEEVAANGRDDDCDGLVGCGTDADRDGFAAPVGDMIEASECPVGTTGLSLGEDCDDADNDIFPSATDVAGNGVDEDCDGADARSIEAESKGEGCACSTADRLPLSAGLLIGVVALRRRRPGARHQGSSLALG